MSDEYESDKFESRAALAAKVEWEGGVMEALDYGIKTEDMPEGDAELTEAWSKLEAAFKAVQPLADAMEKLLEAAADSGDDYEGVES
jgi:hypothetical protein